MKYYLIDFVIISTLSNNYNFQKLFFFSRGNGFKAQKDLYVYFYISQYWKAVIYIYIYIDTFNQIYYLLSKYCWLFDDLLLFFLFKSLWIQASAKCINLNVFNPISYCLYYSRYIAGRIALCYLHPSMTMEYEVTWKYRERAKVLVTHMLLSLSTLINPVNPEKNKNRPTSPAFRQKHFTNLLFKAHDQVCVKQWRTLQVKTHEWKAEDGWINWKGFRLTGKLKSDEKCSLRISLFLIGLVKCLGMG